MLKKKPIHKKTLTYRQKVTSKASMREKHNNGDPNEIYNCEKCGDVFSSGWALGGHASRVHPGES